MADFDLREEIENIISEFCDGTLIAGKEKDTLVFSLEKAWFIKDRPLELADRIIDLIEGHYGR